MGTGRQREPRPPHYPNCPFCPGNEAELPVILCGRASDTGTGWAIRVVRDRYPAFEWEVADDRPPGVGKTLAPTNPPPITAKRSLRSVASQSLR